MARKRIPTPACPAGHSRTRIHSWGTRTSKSGITRRFRCEPEVAGEFTAHVFTVLVKPTKLNKKLLDAVVPLPDCPYSEHNGVTKVYRRGTYTTRNGKKQRYWCHNPATGTSHTFSAVLPRSLVADETCCADCGVPTPLNAGTEASARRNTYPVSVIFTTLRDLSQGESYTSSSLKALEALSQPTGRTRSIANVTPDVLNALNPVGPERDGRAHWHISADILEMFAPIVTQAAFTKIDAEDANFRALGLPVVYVADSYEIKRNYKRSSRRTTSPVVWNALVLSRTKWSDSSGVDYRNRLLRVRALPAARQASWELVFSELTHAPDFLVCDGAAEIANAARVVWGAAVQVIPCSYHAQVNITKGIAPKGVTLPQKVVDHLYALTRKEMERGGAGTVKTWFDELEILIDGAGLPLDAFWNVRGRYEPLLNTTADVAKNNIAPKVPISNSGAEALIRRRVKKLTEHRGPLFSNLPRTNLLGDLVVAGDNGALSDQHTVGTAIRDASRASHGWAPPTRTFDEPLGALALRDPNIVTLLAGTR